MIDIMVIGARGIPDVEGGVEKHTESVFPLLAEKGYAVEIVAMRRFLKAKSFKGVKLTGLPTIRFANTDKVIYHFLALLYAAVKRPKLVHLQGLNSALFLVLYKLAGLKVVVRYGSTDYEHPKWGFIGRLGFRLCALQLRFADYVIVVSQKFRGDLEQRYGLKRVQVVPNGLDRASMSEEAAQFWSELGLVKGRYLLAVGRLSIDKDHKTMIRAFSQIKEPGLSLVIAGGPSEKKYAEWLFAQGSDRIRFLGRVDRRLLAGLYANCAVFVKASRHEGLSNAVLEAISYGCPLVLSDIPANTEMGLDPKVYFPVGNVAALRERLEAALIDREAFVSNGSQFLDWPAIATRTEAVYRKVIPTFGEATPMRGIDLTSETATTPISQGAMRPGVALPRVEAGSAPRGSDGMQEAI